MPHHSMELWPPNDAATVASAPPYRDPDPQPSARCFCVHPAAAVPCSSSAEVRAGPRAPRLSPGPAYTPRSASPVGLAQTAVIPQNNSTSDCYICDPVVLRVFRYVSVLIAVFVSVPIILASFPRTRVLVDAMTAFFAPPAR